jgi:hypothetical protein
LAVRSAPQVLTWRQSRSARLAPFGPCPMFLTIGLVLLAFWILLP